MSPHMPITLDGTNLGERHRYLNFLVADAYSHGESFEAIIALPESSPVDRLFKIDLAAKHKNVEYILTNLRNDDMLYVSRALKSKWLLNKEYRKFINPVYLEDILYPEMITTAVNKMKQWTYLNLNDSVRCLEFYKYYCEKDFDYAFKFLSKCPEDTILKEFPRKETLEKITPHSFKILCERTPTIAKMFFDVLKMNKSLLQNFYANSFGYLNSLKCILKSNADLFLDIIEKHFMIHFKRLSKKTTEFIITHRKDRFMLKPELYVSRILHVETLARCLTQDECDKLVIKLARARYLEDKEHWFTYKNVEPLVKRLDVVKRAEFKTKVFVDKDFGVVVTDWLYPVPELVFESVDVDVFLEEKESPDLYDRLFEPPRLTELFHCGISGRKAWQSDFKCPKPKTLLDVLFDNYRFMSFDKTLFELRPKITSESSSQNRMFMILVLVSKSGGIAKNLEALVQLITEHRNEPSHIRAAVIRSLVKRACVWRVTEDIWKKLLIFGRGLGLDGDAPETECDEGLHAVVIRMLLSDGEHDPAVIKAYLKKFSPLGSYSLTGTEKDRLKKGVLNVLLESANSENNADTAAQILEYALDTLQSYKIKFETRPELIISIKNIAKKDQNAAKDILKRLYHNKFGRKELITENFDLIQTDASYCNALKHDVSILSVEKFVKTTVFNGLTAELFLRKVNIYFNENDGLANRFLIAIKGHKIQKELVRPLVYLIGDDLKSYMLETDTIGKDAKRFSARIRANAHLARPTFKIELLEWRKIGAKHIANKVLRCKTVELDYLIEQLLSWKRTARLAIILAQRTNYENKVFALVAKIRPTIALKSGISYIVRKGDQSDLRIWEIVKTLIPKAKESIKTSNNLLLNIKKVDLIPLSIRPEYATEVFKLISDIDFKKSISVLCHIMLVLPNIEEKFIETILQDFVQNRLTLGKKYVVYHEQMPIILFLRILGKYLLLCKTEESQRRRFDMTGQMFLDRMLYFFESGCNKKLFFQYLDALVTSFSYYEVFLNEEYMSCLPVMKKFVEWMKTFLPMEKYFDKYVTLHLTMLYYKAIRQTMKQMPDVLANEERRRSDGIKVVGETFGKYVGHEAQVLAKKYFDSVVVLYGQGLVQYMRNFNQGRYRMISHIIKGIVDVSDGTECIVALLLYNDNYKYFNDDEILGIRNCLSQKKLLELQFKFIDLNLFSNWSPTVRII